MSTYPGAIDTFRTLQNLPGKDYDAGKETTIFAEDINGKADAIVAIETTLGENPQGDFPDVAERFAGIMDAITYLYEVIEGSIAQSNYDSHPVGSVIIGPDTGESPDEYIPGLTETTWVRIEGRFIIGAIPADDEYDVNDTGGNSTHTLDISQMPAHNHGLPNASTDVTVANPGQRIGGTVYTNSTSGQTASSTGTGTRGNGEAFPIIPPYKAKYIWERIA